MFIPFIIVGAAAAIVREIRIRHNAKIEGMRHAARQASAARRLHPVAFNEERHGRARAADFDFANQ